ncbi:MAG: hypothetical protein AB1757_23700 [Acidobacteriota bacterium]
MFKISGRHLGEFDGAIKKDFGGGRLFAIRRQRRVMYRIKIAIVTKQNALRLKAGEDFRQLVAPQNIADAMVGQNTIIAVNRFAAIVDGEIENLERLG